MTKFIVAVFGFALCMIISIWVMIFGWGLEVKNWWWVIGGGFFVRLIISIMEQLAKIDR